jgi:RNA polymerase sigma factor (sigma-70 family)
MSPSDHDLLRAYARDGSQAAFATLVERHLNLVYSAARRQVRSPQLAEEIAQSVFADLARHASHMTAATPLVAWLHVVCRRTAIDVIRRESRRVAREEHAAEIARLESAMKPNPSNWAAVEPLLDEAVESLTETDRAAILLRYFENKSLREVGAALGASEDAAQKRVSRAVEQLRAFFLRRGLAVTAAGLTTDLSAHALQTAPASLGATISAATAMFSSAGALATSQTAHVIAMTTLQKTFSVAAFAAVGGFGLFEASLAARQSNDLRTARERTERTSAEIHALRLERDAAAARLKSVEQQIDARLAAPPISPSDLALQSQMKVWLERIDSLKQFLERHPEFNIPELQLLTSEQWFTLVGDKPVDSEDAARQSTSQLRHMAENMFASKLSRALRAYLKANADILPASPRELAPFFDSPIDPASLDRYEISFTGKASDVPHAGQYKILSVKNPADPEFDSVWSIGPNGFGTTSALGVDIMEATRRFKEANPGQQPTSADQLRPYLKWPVSDGAVQKDLDFDRSRARTP